MVLKFPRLNSSKLTGRFVVNAGRQALGAGIFFAYTLLLTKYLGSSKYAVFFLSLSSAQIIAAIANMGVSNYLLRGLVLGGDRQAIMLTAARASAVQIAACVGLSILGQFLTSSAWEVSCLIAISTLVGTQASAIALGLDKFELFSFGELLQNLLGLMLVALIQPSTAQTAALLLLVAACVKLCITWLFSGIRSPQATSPAHIESFTESLRHALMGYVHGLFQTTFTRGLPFAFVLLIGSAAFTAIAPVWALMDRTMLLVQGANQMLYPKLVGGSLNWRKAVQLNFLLLLLYVLVAGAMCLLWGAAHTGLNSLVLQPAAQGGHLLIFFGPLAFWLLMSSNLLARVSYRHLFLGHASNLIALGSMVIASHFFNAEKLLPFHILFGGLLVISSLIALSSRDSPVKGGAPDVA
jgi:hypothetical protein